jgi:cytoskeletal protein CcmA (bactofilin family)
MTKTRKLLFTSLFVVLLVPAAALAFTAKSGNSVSVGKTEVVDGNFFAAGQNIQIEGKVNGDVFCAGQSVNINGEVAGDVICAASSINVNGRVGGNLRVAGSAINLNGQVGRNLMVAGASLSTGASSSVGWEALMAVASADLRGKIGRDLTGAGATYDLGGAIGRDVQLWLDNNQRQDQSTLKVEKDATIGGKLTYTAKQDAEVVSGARIAGEVKRLEPAARYQQPSPSAKTGAWFLFAIYWMIAVSIVGVVLVMLWGEETKRLLTNFTTKAQASFGWGLIALLLTPLICILLLITIIGIPLAAILGLFWLLALSLSKLFVSIFIGQKLLERFWQARKDSLYAATILGVAVCYFVFLIPAIGWLLGLLATIWGMGAIYLFFKKA